MPSASWDDLLPDTDPAQTVAFMKSWHGLLPETAGGGRRWTSITQFPMRRAINGSLSDIISAIEADGLAGLIHPPATGRRGGTSQDLYHHIGVTKSRPEQGFRGRGSDVDMIPGAWADFDVKAGAFRSWDDIYTVIQEMDRLGIGPQIIVMTGSGGAHCYWRAKGGLAPEQAGMYTKRIRRWVLAEFGTPVDNVADPARIMRLPGSVRFPKSGESLDPVTVTMPRIREEFADLEALARVTQDAWMAVEERTQEQRIRIMEDVQALEAVAVEEMEFQGRVASSGHVDLRDFYMSLDDEDDTGWDTLWRRYAFIEAFDATVTWAQILEPAGWEKFGDPDDEGRQMWTRPGPGPKNPRSAITDWEGGTNMSLLSDAPETGLSHLHELAEDATRKMYKLSKARVAAELKYGGSMSALMAAWLRAHRSARKA